MPRPLVEFEDGSVIESHSRESLRYRKGDHSALVAVYFERGWFKRGSIIDLSDLEKWEKAPKGASAKISNAQRWEIVARTLEYFARAGYKCRTETMKVVFAEGHEP
jgi:hypothetical protein